MAIPPESGHILWMYVECAFEEMISQHLEEEIGTYACDSHVMVGYARQALIDAVALMQKQGVVR